jgi:ParB family chromosome partitioning protein
VADRLVHVSRIEPHPDNPRTDIGDVTELAASIRVHGILEPLVVCQHPQRPGNYQLLAGHRRLAAAKRARLDQVPVVIRPAPAEPVILMLVENCQRADLTAVEKAEAMGALSARGYSATRIARETGLSVSSVSTYLSLLDLDEASRELVSDGRVRVADAVAAVRSTRRASRRSQGKHPRKTSIAAEHFSGSHPLAGQARAACALAGHGGRKYGKSAAGLIACGECWEAVIRGDERAAARKVPA